MYYIQTHFPPSHTPLLSPQVPHFIPRTRNISPPPPPPFHFLSPPHQMVVGCPPPPPPPGGGGGRPYLPLILMRQRAETSNRHFEIVNVSRDLRLPQLIMDSEKRRGLLILQPPASMKPDSVSASDTPLEAPATSSPNPLCPPSSASFIKKDLSLDSEQPFDDPSTSKDDTPAAGSSSSSISSPTSSNPSPFPSPLPFILNYFKKILGNKACPDGTTHNSPR